MQSNAMPRKRPNHHNGSDRPSVALPQPPHRPRSKDINSFKPNPVYSGRYCPDYFSPRAWQTDDLTPKPCCSKQAPISSVVSRPRESRFLDIAHVKKFSDLERARFEARHAGVSSFSKNAISSKAISSTRGFTRVKRSPQPMTSVTARNSLPISSHLTPARPRRAATPAADLQRRRFYRRQQRQQTWAVGLESLAWIASAALLRWTVDVVMAMSSQFWLLGVLLAIAPAIAAIWLTQATPRMGLVIGYRCLLIMLGLLLGGTFGGWS